MTISVSRDLMFFNQLEFMFFSCSKNSSLLILHSALVMCLDPYKPTLQRIIVSGKFSAGLTDLKREHYIC